MRENKLREIDIDKNNGTSIKGGNTTDICYWWNYPFDLKWMKNVMHGKRNLNNERSQDQNRICHLTAALIYFIELST